MSIQFGYTHYDSKKTKNAVMKYAHGCFQRALLNGDEAWSAMTLVGEAASYRKKYVVSGENLLERIEAAGYVVERVKGPHSRREYRISAPVSVAKAA